MKFVVFLAIAIAACAAVASASLHTRWHELEPTGYSFDKYVAEYRKVYADENEREFRRSVFNTHLKEVLEHNRKDLSWKLGVNHLSDRTDEEIAKLRGYKKHLANAEHVRSRRAALATEFTPMTPASLPASVDWRLKGAVSPVKDQGNCGSCWTFATAETVESFWFLRTGQMFELSEQQIASCTPNPLQCGGTGGCEGGTAEVGFQGIIDAGGVMSEWQYPYMSWNGTDYVCRINQTGFAFNAAANLSSYVKLPVNDQNALMTAVATLGPIAISVDASAWSFYESGVFAGCNTTAPTIDHAVQLLGYGTDNGNDYWLVRNSWAPQWGELGTIRLARPASAPCGTDPNPGDGTACQPYPATQYVCGMCGILSDSAYPIVGV